MNGTPPPVFRPAAVRHYAHRRTETAAPPFVSPHAFLVLWILLALLLTGTLSAWLVRVPVYASTMALAVRANGTSDAIVLAALVPPGEIGRLRVGQRLLLDIGGQQATPASGYLERRIIALDRTIRSPEELRRRLGLQSTAGLAVTGPAAVAFAPLEPVSGRAPASVYRGSIYRAEIEVGSTRVLALVPVVGDLLGG